MRRGRRTGMRRTLVLVLLLLHATLGARAAYACSCIGQRTVHEAVAQAETVFAGEVVEVRGNRYKVRVHGVVKGRLPPTVTLRGLPETNSCGTTLPLGPIFYAAGPELEAAQCMAIYSGDFATRTAATFDTYPPDPSAPDPGRSRMWPIALAVLALGGAATGYRAVKRHRPPVPSGHVLVKY